MMNRIKNIVFIFCLLTLVGFGKSLQQSETTSKTITVWLIGDSTMADYSNSYDKGDYMKTRYPVTGWGQVFQPFLSGENLIEIKSLLKSDSVIVKDMARGGRSTRTFFQEGRWRAVYDNIQKGDFVLIQFGHNDAAENKTERYVNEEGYKEFLRLFIHQTRQKKGTPVLITPVARNYPWENDTLKNVHGNYPDCMKEVAAETGTLLIDLNQRSMEHFTKKGREYVTHNYFMNLPAAKYEAYPEGQKDNTHFQPQGATAVASLVYEGLKDLAQASTNKRWDFTVAKDGSGDFTTVQEAIDAVPDFRKNRTTIFIKAGIYKEKLVLPASKTLVSFIGEDVNNTILTYDDFAQKKNLFGEELGTTGSSSFFVFGEGFTAENITFENSAGPVGQAVAVRIDGDKVAFRNCRFLGNQDTLYPHGNNSRQYYKNCYIEGTVDFIFGWSTAVFDQCTIFCKEHGYITAPSTEENTEFGFVFLNCNITGSAPENSFYLGRPWRPFGKAVFIECNLEEHIKPEGWHNWGSTEKEKTAFFAEYNNSGKGSNSAERVKWSHQLNAEQAKKYTVQNILGDWQITPETFQSELKN